MYSHAKIQRTRINLHLDGCTREPVSSKGSEVSQFVVLRIELVTPVLMWLGRVPEWTSTVEEGFVIRWWWYRWIEPFV